MKEIYVVVGGLWFDKVNGKTYHRSKIIKVSTGDTYYTPYAYGNGNQYMRSAIDYIMIKEKKFKVVNAGSFSVKKEVLEKGFF